MIDLITYAAAVKKAAQNSSVVTSAINDIEDDVSSLDNNKSDKTKINIINDVTVTITAENNNEYRCMTSVTNLTLTYPADLENDSDYASAIMFRTGSTAPSINYNQPLILSGMDVTTDTIDNGTVYVFEPQRNYSYIIGLIWDGSNMNAIVRGAAI